jgi:flagellar basal-body rod modification protein FlgD
MSTIIPTTTQPSPTPTTQAAKNVLGKDDFLNLLVTQMQNQDPLDPMQGTDFAAQLAQFSSLEQLTNINDNLQQSLQANALLSSSINNALSATFIGKDVRAMTDTFNYSANGTNVQLGYSLTYAADSAVVTISDSAGNVVRTLNGGTNSGQNDFTWDGKNEKGESVGAGTYTMKVEAKDTTGAPLDVQTYVVGKVSGVRFKQNGAVFVIDGVEISISDVMEIMQG